MAIRTTPTGATRALLAPRLDPIYLQNGPKWAICLLHNTADGLCNQEHHLLELLRNILSMNVNNMHVRRREICLEGLVGHM